MLPALLPLALPLAPPPDLELEVLNLGLEASEFALEGGLLSMRVRELQQGHGDLNGDGDESDTVLFVFDTRSGELHEPGVAVGPPQGGLPFAIPLADRLYFTIPEGPQGATDLNGDGDAADRVLHSYSTDSEELLNFGTACDHYVPGPFGIAFVAPENEQAGVDVNGDGDSTDFMLGIADPSGKSETLGIATSNFVDAPPVVAGRWMAAHAHEQWQGQDLNGDGDLLDAVPQVHDFLTGTTSSLGVASGGVFAAGLTFVMEDTLLIGVSESFQGGIDLTGDGEADDTPYFAIDLLSGAKKPLGNGIHGPFASDGTRVAMRVAESADGIDLNGDGDTADPVVAVFDARTNELTHLGHAAASFGLSVDGDVAAFRVPEEYDGKTDLNGDGDVDDDVWHAYSFETGTVSNLLTDSFTVSILAGRVGYRVRESVVGADLNGDGDLHDRIPRVYDSASGEVLQASTAATTLGPWLLADRLLYFASEASNGGADLDGDGETGGAVLSALDLVSGETEVVQGAKGAFFLQAEGRTIVFDVHEDIVGEDLNGDGDLADEVIHVGRLQP